MNVLRRLFRFLRPHVGLLSLSFILLCLAGFLGVLTTALLVPLFDKGLTLGQDSAAGASLKKMVIQLIQSGLSLIPGGIITEIAIAIVVLTLFKGICLYYSNYSMSYIGQRVVTDLRTKLFGHVLNQSIAFFSLNSTGRLMSRMSGDVEQVQEAVSTSLADLFREVIDLVSYITWIFYIDWKLALLSFLIAPFALVMTLTMGRRIRTVSVKGREDAATLNDHLQQSITGMRIIKAFGMESHEEQSFRKSSFRLLRSNMKAAAIVFLNSPAMELLGILAFIPLLYYAHAKIVDKTLTFGMFGSALFSIFRMYDPIRKLSRIHVQFQRTLASGSRIMELMDAHLEIKDRFDARPLHEFRDSIEFRNVAFDYVDQNGETQVLRDINLKVNRNCVIAVVGSSGSGKSTLASLIPRFYDPTAGSVMIDGVDIREYSQRTLRSQIAIVTQETFLFNDTVRNNIAYGDLNASEEKIIEASRAALADDFIMSFPMRYQTLIGERGQRLSGGERQRLAIARALLKNAPILILDEATSALDSESEKLVQRALTNLIKDRTTFVIAHRLSTIRNADMIIVLDHGRIIESGNHDSLMDNEGPYRKFFRLQTDVQSAVGSG
jgi:ATP-binding cassette, subfamily B, bacterial MsbA